MLSKEESLAKRRAWRKKKMEDPEYRDRINAQKRAYHTRRYANDLEYRERTRANAKAWISANEQKNREWKNAWQKAWRKNNPEKIRAYREKTDQRPERREKARLREAQRRKSPEVQARVRELWRRKHVHPFAPEFFERAWTECLGRCEICWVDEMDLKAELAVDHDHATGYLRGLLCHRCNLRLGWYEKYRKALSDYLRRARGRRSYFPPKALCVTRSGTD